MKKKKRKSKVKRFMRLIIILVIVSSAIYAVKVTSTYRDSKDRCIYVNNNMISFDCVGGYKYIHLRLSNSDSDPVSYNIISPSGKTMKTDQLTGSSDFFSNTEKGMWKVTFNVNKEININYKVWEGNFKFRDTMK